MEKQEGRVSVSIRAFEARMRRHMLSAQNVDMKKCRHDSRWYQDMGPYYFVHTATNGVEHRGIDLYTLIKWAREGSVLKPYEDVVTD